MAFMQKAQYLQTGHYLNERTNENYSRNSTPQVPDKHFPVEPEIPREI